MSFLVFKYFILFCLIKRNSGVKFIRTIEAIGFPYYIISFKLGTCQEYILFSEHKAWPITRMNRILDIYYKSEISEYTVSSVEIKVVINNTDCMGYSKTDVGAAEFSATIFLATNMAFIFYSLTIYTCYHDLDKISSNEEGLAPNLPFYTNQPNHLSR